MVPLVFRLTMENDSCTPQSQADAIRSGERCNACDCGAGKLKLPQFLWGRAACNVWLLVPKRLRDFGATALDENSQHDHEKHTGNYLDHGDAVHNESPFLKVFFYR
jgi:hypothetical protein